MIIELKYNLNLQLLGVKSHMENHRKQNKYWDKTNTETKQILRKNKYSSHYMLYANWFLICESNPESKAYTDTIELNLHV